MDAPNRDEVVEEYIKELTKRGFKADQAEKVAENMFKIYKVLLTETNYGLRAAIGLGAVADVLRTPPSSCDTRKGQAT